jgi:hypothetical protein
MACDHVSRFFNRYRTAPAKRYELGHRTAVNGYGDPFTTLYATQNLADGIAQLPYGHRARHEWEL